MPIYEYRCTSCGHEKEILQKMSDAPLKDCPACGKSTFSKLISAAGFQLKGSGWYVTDFKGGQKTAAKAEEKKEGATGEATPREEGRAKEESKAKSETGAKDGAKEQSTADKPAGNAGTPAA